MEQWNCNVYLKHNLSINLKVNKWILIILILSNNKVNKVLNYIINYIVLIIIIVFLGNQVNYCKNKVLIVNELLI